jgi:AcrR family transcriptional regulator
MGMKQVAAPRTRAQMSVETRARLIALAREAFGTKGYAATSLDDLTVAAGQTRGAIYHHFDGKLDLFAAVVSEIEGELDAHYERAMAAAGSGWPGFRAGSRAYLQALQMPDIRRIILHDAPAMIPGFPSQPHMKLCTETIVETLTKLMAEGAITQADPEALANAIAGAVNAAAAWAATREDPVAALAAAQEAIDRLLDGLSHAE